MEIIKPGNGLDFPASGTIECQRCGCVFKYSYDDVEEEAALGGGIVLYHFIECPNETCEARLIVHDNRFFIFRWFDFWALPARFIK